ncbi:MAG: hypothetical protein COA96_03415 [SAR86 cluster bacterium]|uniref:PAS domain-containing protein n=1 Tax=SAR86 cluster bacterium TaxID=2030880 RepID=A0A2A5B6P3_9GAMM|nr:MAG: hypothetical protein COA96_03415 [SAR86 cluster bacterium]
MNTSLSYLLFAQGFIIFLILMMVAGLWINFLNSRKAYLAIACAAGLVESIRQIPDLMLSLYPDSITYYFLSITLQFSALLVLLSSLIMMKSKLNSKNLWLILLPIICFLSSVAYQVLVEPPASVASWYLLSISIYIVLSMIIWHAWQIGTGLSPARIFLVATSMALLAIRIALPAMQLDELFYLTYYAASLIFPLMLAAINLAEVEYTNKTVQLLLADRTQSEKDLQFILDHSLDVILMADKIGLILTWNKRAEAKFGYTASQTIGKMHMDELFAVNYWQKNIKDSEEFISKMAHTQGNIFAVAVRTKTVIHNQKYYNIYVLRDASDLENPNSAMSSTKETLSTSPS